MKNNSHKGDKGIAPFVKNMKAILGTCSNGNSLTLGTNDARQINSSSSMVCMRGCPFFDSTVEEGGIGGGCGGKKGGDDCGRSCGSGGDSEGCKDEKEKRWDMYKLEFKQSVIPMDKPIRKETIWKRKGNCKRKFETLGKVRLFWVSFPIAPLGDQNCNIGSRQS